MINRRLGVYLAQAIQPFLKHTYTYQSNDSVPVLDVEENQTYNTWDQPIMTDPAPVTGQRCLFLYDTIANQNIDGAVLNLIPTLYVESDSPVTENDIVLNVQDEDDNTILQSARVESIDKTFDVGLSVIKVLRLSGAVTRGN